MQLYKSFQRANVITKSVHRIEYIHRFITFNANDNENKRNESDNSDSSKPLDKNFVFRLYQELGKKSQDRQAQESLKMNPDGNEDNFNSTSDYFRQHDRPSHRLFGMYYKMAHSEIASFNLRGFGSINHLMHPMIPQELPLLHETMDGIFTNTIEFDAKKYMENSELALNLDIGHLRSDIVGMEGARETKINDTMSIVLPLPYKPKIYNQQSSIIKNVRNCITELKGNYFEFRGLSIAKQLFVDLLRSNVIQNDLSLLSDDIFIIDARNFFESLEKETIKFPSPQLVSICDINDTNTNQEKAYLICVLAIQNSIVTLKKRDFDENNIPPNIPLAGGSALLVDPNLYSQILYWRRTNEPATFFINTYGEKF